MKSEARLIKQFVQCDEAAAMLSTDAEGLRQAFELGLGERLPAYAYSGAGGFLAALRGRQVNASGAILPDGTQSLSLTGGQSFDPDGWRDARDLGDDLGEVSLSTLRQTETGHPVTFSLRGFFRLLPEQLRDGARNGHFDLVAVAPASWWTDAAPIGRDKHGTPVARFDLLPTKDGRYLDPPSFADLWYRVTDIEAVKEPRPSQPSASGLDLREKTSLLRIIRVLDAMAELKKRGPATSIAAELTRQGFKGPAEATIRKVIAEARALEPDDKPQ